MSTVLSEKRRSQNSNRSYELLRSAIAALEVLECGSYREARLSTVVLREDEGHVAVSELRGEVVLLAEARGLDLALLTRLSGGAGSKATVSMNDHG